MCHKCVDCIEHSAQPPSSKPATWNIPTGPWKRIHVDFAGMEPQMIKGENVSS